MFNQPHPMMKKLNLLDIKTPRSNSFVTDFKTCTPKEYYIKFFVMRANVREFAFKLKPSCRLADQLNNPFKSYWIISTSIFCLSLCLNLASSTNLAILFGRFESRSYTKIINKIGHNTKPRGMPLVTCTQSNFRLL